MKAKTAAAEPNRIEPMEDSIRHPVTGIRFALRPFTVLDLSHLYQDGDCRAFKSRLSESSDELNFYGSLKKLVLIDAVFRNMPSRKPCAKSKFQHILLKTRVNEHRVAQLEEVILAGNDAPTRNPAIFSFLQYASSGISFGKFSVDSFRIWNADQVDLKNLDRELLKPLGPDGAFSAESFSRDELLVLAVKLLPVFHPESFESEAERDAWLKAQTELEQLEKDRAFYQSLLPNLLNPSLDLSYERFSTDIRNGYHHGRVEATIISFRLLPDIVVPNPKEEEWIDRVVSRLLDLLLEA